MAEPLRGAEAERQTTHGEPAPQGRTAATAAKPSGGTVPLCCQAFRFDLSTGVTHVSCAAVPSQRDGAERRGGVIKTTETGAAVQHSPAGRGQPDAEGGNTAAQRRDAETSESCFAFLSLCEAAAGFESAVIHREHSECFFF